jgi:predicted HTH transcriptional regulator
MTAVDDITPKSRIPIDGEFSVERLRMLIKLGVEEARLDYKNEYNLSGSKGTKDKVELVRDIVGMANTYGGYIVLGVHEVTDSTGKRFSPDGMSQEACALLDVSALRQQVDAYISERIEIQFKLHVLSEYGGNTFGIIFIPPSPHSPIIFSIDGQYTDRSDLRNRNISMFFAGDVVVRKGASTEKTDQSDMRRIISEIRQREKSRWTEEILGMRDLVLSLDQLIAILSRDSRSPFEQPQ